MIETALLMMLGLELKHFVADYLLQSRWILSGKGDFRQAGGYAHAAIHGAGSVLAMTVLAIGWSVILPIVAAEVAIHYGLDYAKEHYTRGISERERPWAFWALNGMDQFFHHLTYVGMTYASLLVLQG